MHARLLTSLWLLVGCPGSDGGSDVVVPIGDTGTPGSEGPDTGTAFMMWHGSVRYDPVQESFTGTRGFGAMTLTNSTFVCNIEARFEGSKIGPQGCPDCEWSFTTRITGGGMSGAHCDDFVGSTAFDVAEYTDFYFGTALDGFGWTEAYTYSYAGTDYDLANVVWAHISTGAYDGWYLYGYDIPSMGIRGVEGDQYAAEFQRYATTGNNTKLYYYFYY